jgi:hypothetical protein
MDKPIFSRIIDNLSTLFGGLDYTRHKIPDFEYSPDPPTKKFDEYEYLYEKWETTGNNTDEWNIRGKEGWEMVQRDFNGFIIWKRKIN